jgi:hypothetical protein
LGSEFGFMAVDGAMLSEKIDGKSELSAKTIFELVT